MNKLPAILGGEVTFKDHFSHHNTIGNEEKIAVSRVLDSGVLSGYVGAWVPEFFGGKEVKNLENNWAEYFGIKHAIAVNSATSGLMASIGALGIEPGDEVIVTPTTMTATTTAILLYHAIPIFADICPNTFCIDPSEVEKLITEKTRAILGVDIYGETANWDKLNEIANKYGLRTLEDAAQSVGGEYNGKNSGTLADIGVFSLNRHKLIQCGEGGICVTNDDDLADRLRLIRNHAEAVVEDKGTKNLVNLVGFNFRLPELEASIANEQLKKLQSILDHRISISEAIIEQFSQFEGIVPPLRVKSDDVCNNKELCCRPYSTITKHTYYYICFKIDQGKFGMSREAFVKAMNKEGIPLEKGGYRPLYLQPIFKNKIAFGNKGYPFTADYFGKEINYEKGLCPVAEKMWFEDLFYFPIDEVIPTFEDVAKFGLVVEKILKHKDEIENTIKNAK